MSSDSATPASTATSGKRAQPAARESDSDTDRWIAGGKLARKDVASYPTYTYYVGQGNRDRAGHADDNVDTGAWGAVPRGHRSGAWRLEHRRSGPGSRRLRKACD